MVGRNANRLEVSVDATQRMALVTFGTLELMVGYFTAVIKPFESWQLNLQDFCLDLFWHLESFCIIPASIWTISLTALEIALLTALGITVHTPQHQHIVKEFWDFALSLRYHTFQGRPEPSVVHAALVGINTIVNISMKDQKTRLINEYAQQLVETKDWVIGRWLTVRPL